MEQMVSVKPAGSHASAATGGHLEGLGKAEAAAQGPSRQPHPLSTKSAVSHQSSLTSLEGSSISERLPRKSLCQAGGPPLEVSIHMGKGSEPQGHSLHLLELSAYGSLHIPFILRTPAAPVLTSYNPTQHSGLMPSATSLL